MWCMSRHIVVMKLPSSVALTCGLLNHLNSFREGMFKLNTKSDADSLPYLFTVISNVTATQYTCSLNGLYHPQCLVQWGCHCPHHVHSSWLSLAARLHQCHTNCSHCINNGGNFFPDRPHILSSLRVEWSLFTQDFSAFCRIPVWRISAPPTLISDNLEIVLVAVPLVLLY